MPRRRKRNQSRTRGDVRVTRAEIERALKRSGGDKSKAVARLTDSRDNSGSARQLSTWALNQIGFSDRFIDQLPGHLAPKDNDRDNRGGGGSGGGGGGGGQSGPPPKTPAEIWQEQYEKRLEEERQANAENAFDMFQNLLEGWGVPVGNDIRNIVWKAAQDGITPDMIELIIPDIQETNTWKNRFPGWHKRVSNGYNQLSVGEYLSLENSYHRIMQSAGLPAGFYDSPADFGQWIAGNVSPDEVQSRVSSAVDLVREIDPTARNLLTQLYGVGSGDIAAYFLDPERAMPTLDRQYKAVSIGAHAARQGLSVNARRFEDLVDKGVTEEMAAQGYSTVARFTDVLGNLGDIYGIDYTQEDAEADVFFNESEKRRKLVSQERAAFSGSSGFQSGVSGRGSTAGAY